MAKTKRLVKSLSGLILPAILLVLLAVAGASVWLTFTIAHPQTAQYLVTPEKYGQLSSRGAQVTDETWTNRDGSSSRGWLLRGTEGSPAVILFHKYGADRSYILNLGVKLNESTNFTVLMPDLRAHGVNPGVKNASFGGCESEDAVAAVEFLRNLKTPNQITLIGKNIGLYGIELGSVAALNIAAKDTAISAIALDSAPKDSDEILSETVGRRFPFGSIVTSKLAKLGTYFYYYDGCYKRESACDVARQIENRKVLLLAGVDEPAYQASTTKLAKCFPVSNKIESKLDLSPSGFNIINASMDQSEGYDQRLIDFFRSSLTN
jgi:pimeloyl-ACP methyl ester carboxylesterase